MSVELASNTEKYNDFETEIRNHGVHMEAEKWYLIKIDIVMRLLRTIMA